MVAIATAIVLGVVATGAVIQSVVMVTRFGALWDAAFLVGLAATLALVSLGLYRNRVDAEWLGVATLGTIATYMLSEAAPIIKFEFTGPGKWLRLSIACALVIIAFLLAVTPGRRSPLASAES
jgi:hypothetical protein